MPRALSLCSLNSRGLTRRARPPCQLLSIQMPSPHSSAGALDIPFLRTASWPSPALLAALRAVLLLTHTPGLRASRCLDPLVVICAVSACQG